MGERTDGKFGGRKFHEDRTRINVSAQNSSIDIICRFLQNLFLRMFVI